MSIRFHSADGALEILYFSRIVAYISIQFSLSKACEAFYIQRAGINTKATSNYIAYDALDILFVIKRPVEKKLRIACIRLTLSSLQTHTMI